MEYQNKPSKLCCPDILANYLKLTESDKINYLHRRSCSRRIIFVCVCPRVRFQTINLELDKGLGNGLDFFMYDVPNKVWYFIRSEDLDST